MIRGIRGAVTVEEDTPEEVLAATRELVEEIVQANGIEPEKVASVLISTTPDVTSAFPAKAVRTLQGWAFVPIMCTHEMNVPGALPRCIRVMLHVNTEVAQHEIQHIFLKEAVQLRPDLAEKREGERA